MKRSSTEPTKRRRGLGLVEVIVSSALMAIVVFAVYEVLIHGMRFYRLNTQMSDAQRAALSLLASMNSNLQNTKYQLTYVDTSLAGGNSAGIVYTDCFDNDGKIQFDPASAQIIWQAYGVYYLNTNGEVRLTRVPFAPTTQPLAPSIATPAPVTPLNFVGQKEGKLVAQHISAMNFIYQTATQGGFFVITIECGKAGSKDDYWLRLQSSVYPRNSNS